MRRDYNCPRLRLRVSVVLVCIVASVALAFGYAFVPIRSHYSAYDDEGFMLMTLRRGHGRRDLIR